jgi:hypothetical protein
MPRRPWPVNGSGGTQGRGYFMKTDVYSGGSLQNWFSGIVGEPHLNLEGRIGIGRPRTFVCTFAPKIPLDHNNVEQNTKADHPNYISGKKSQFIVGSVMEPDFRKRLGWAYS